MTRPGLHHLSLGVTDIERSARFYDAALRSDGAPGPRPAYGEHYYAAFVLDPDSHRLEAVIDTPPEMGSDPG